MNNGDSDQLLKIYDYYVLRTIHYTYCKKIGYRLIKCVTQGKAGFALVPSCGLGAVAAARG